MGMPPYRTPPIAQAGNPSPAAYPSAKDRFTGTGGRFSSLSSQARHKDTTENEPDA
jgi:hypothetical protein